MKSKEIKCPSIVNVVTIECLEDGDVNVLGIPPNVFEAIGIMNAAVSKVVLSLIGRAQRGEVDIVGNCKVVVDE